MCTRMASLDDSRMEELTSPAYGSELLERFNQFRQDEMFCDYTIKVENTTFKVHKLIIAGFSDYFRAMFSHGMIETNTNSIELQSVTVDGLRPLLDYAYTGKLHINMVLIQDVLPVAAFLQVTSALNILSNYLKSKMTFENSNHLVSLSESYGMSDLANHEKRMILDRFLEFTDTEQFLCMSPEQLIGYLEENTLSMPSEAQLLKRVLRWYHHDKSAREESIHLVLDRIRYTLDGWPAIEYARSQEPFASNKMCEKILDRCDDFMQNANRKYLNQSYRTRVRYEGQSIVQMGGIKFFVPDGMMGFLLPGEEDIDQEPNGSGRNHYYHKHLQQWLPLGINGVADSRSHNPLVAINDYAIMVGGYLYTTDNIDTPFQHCSNEVKMFTPTDFASWDLPYMKVCRAHHTAVYTSGFLYAIGGKNETGSLTTVEKYDCDKEFWVFVHPLEIGLFDHASTTHKDRVYVSGGVVNNVIVNTVWCYEPDDDKWIVKPPLLATRAGHTMTQLGDRLIACGGSTTTSTSRCLASVEVYALDTEQWSFISPMRVDCAHMSATVLEDKLYVLGGQNSVGDLIDDVQVFDPKNSKWGIYCHLEEPMKNVGCCSVTIKLSPTGVDCLSDDSVQKDFLRQANRYFESEEESDDDDFDDMLQMHLMAQLDHWQI